MESKVVRLRGRNEGQRFGVSVDVLDATTGAVLHTTRVRPYGFTSAAHREARDHAELRGWTVYR